MARYIVRAKSITKIQKAVTIYFSFLKIKLFQMKNKITKLRKEKKITQQELADQANVTRQTIISLEHGRYNPSLELAHKITKILKQKHIEDVFQLN